MKKILLLILALMLALALVSCGEDENANNANGGENAGENLNKEPNGDNGGNTDNESGNNNGINGNISNMVSQKVIGQLENAASLKVEISVESVINSEYWIEGEKYTPSMNDLQTITVTVAKADTITGYNLKVDGERVSGNTVEKISGMLYFVDGVVYEYDEFFEAYFATELEAAATTEMMQIIAMLETSAGVSIEEMEELFTMLGVEILSSFNFTDGKASVTADLKPVLDGLMSYIKELDVNTKTLESLINDVLSLIDEELTAESLVYLFSEFGALTVEEILEMANDMLTESYGMTLQEFYSAIIATPDFQESFTAALKESGLSNAEIEAYLNRFASFNIEESIPSEYMDMTMYELLLMIAEYSRETEEEDSYVEYVNEVENKAPTLEELTQMVNMMLDMTLSEVEEMFDVPFSQMIDLAKGFTTNALNFQISLEVNNLFQISSVIGQFNYDVTAGDIYSGATQNQQVKIIIKIYDISDKAIVIEAPTNIFEY